MERQLVSLKKIVDNFTKRADTDAVSTRVNGYTLFLKEGGKHNQWKSVGKKEKEQLATRAKKLNGTSPYEKKKSVDATFNEDLSIFIRPKGRPPKGMVWNDKTGNYQKDKLPVKKCKHKMMRGKNKGKACGKKCTGEYCTAHLKHYVTSSESESSLEESELSESELSETGSSESEEIYDDDE